MFCCTQNPSHQGQIVTSICQDPNCIQKQSQLCCTKCIRDIHQSHSNKICTMKQILPELLNAHNLKNYYESLLVKLCTFVRQEFSSDELVREIIGQNGIDLENVTDITPEIMLKLRRINRQQNKKIKDIQKTLHTQNHAQQSMYQQPQSSKLPSSLNLAGKNASSPLKMGSSKFQTVPMAVSQIVGNLDSFCHTLKHPYVSLSPDSNTAWKNTEANGYKLAALSAGSISKTTENYFFTAKIQKSSGSILLGLAVPQIVKQKDFLNVYGSGQGAFMLGQNGNDVKSAIIFHHCDNMFNRKQIVGWNFKEGDVLGIGLIKDNEKTFISYRMYNVTSSGKIDKFKVTKQFTMPLSLSLEGKDSKYQRLHFIALLQNVGDSVTILPNEE